ncbi:hypothetical protein EJ06DRAFT_527400 [Trichodelitschia bisporula]|uniref:Uncharacterized protein n=1 Tax=Trichodelitschia bisporula TaxID=703511 RepID=A0A6G1I692_9PEZI|nr:hypothetical protein EJ06DRAFT_527400 [Trichodelitschia bisporula]
MGSLRAGTYTDMYGNIITNPDPSNPTRRRDERPLETIRSFEAAIDGDYRRQHAHEYDAQSRRSSAHWGRSPDPSFLYSRDMSRHPSALFKHRFRSQYRVVLDILDVFEFVLQWILRR